MSVRRSRGRPRERRHALRCDRYRQITLGAAAHLFFDLLVQRSPTLIVKDNVALGRRSREDRCVLELKLIPQELNIKLV